MKSLLLPKSFVARLSFAVAIGVSSIGLALPVSAQRVDGIWDATVTVNDVAIPFQLELSTNGQKASTYFFNGDEKVNPSTEGVFQNGHLNLKFASYATELKAVWKDGELSGSFDAGRGNSYPFRAQRHIRSSGITDTGNVPLIDGLWEIQVKSPKGESAWRFVVRQSGAKVSAAVLRVDGDTGILSGRYKDGKFVLSHFTGERPFYAEVDSLPDQTLKIDIFSSRDKQSLIAYRPDVARSKGLAPPDNPMDHTRLKNQSEPLHFAFPDLNGKLLSDQDARFKGKVVLVNITGSWCPNCHDEAPFLQELYRKYHQQGLEIVALDFEPSEQLSDPSRLRAFIQRYGIEYVYLLAGEPSDLNEKIPQALNLNAWPTTFFVGRDGLVHEIHTGFTSLASREFDSQLKSQITASVERLLSDLTRR